MFCFSLSAIGSITIRARQVLLSYKLAVVAVAVSLSFYDINGL